MAEKENGQQQADEATQDGAGAAAEPKNTDTTALGPVPYERFKEVNDALKELRDWKTQQEQAETERQKAAEAARQKSLKEQEKWQELAQAHEAKVTELEPQLEATKAERDEAYDVLTAHAEAMMESVPELYRPLVEELPVLKRLRWLTDNREKLTTGRPAGTPATPNGKGRGELTDAERRQKARTIRF